MIVVARANCQDENRKEATEAADSVVVTEQRRGDWKKAGVTKKPRKRKEQERKRRGGNRQNGVLDVTTGVSSDRDDNVIQKQIGAKKRPRLWAKNFNIIDEQFRKSKFRVRGAKKHQKVREKCNFHDLNSIILKFFSKKIVKNAWFFGWKTLI